MQFRQLDTVDVWRVTPIREHDQIAKIVPNSDTKGSEWEMNHALPQFQDCILDPYGV